MVNKLAQKAKNIQLLLTDCDGVLTDASVYYSERGEELRKFSVRDGMGVERLKQLAHIEVGIVSGEPSKAIQKRGEKLQITEIHLGVKDKKQVILEIQERLKLTPYQVAYLGDDVNDLSAMDCVGLTACPKDAVPEIKKRVDLICETTGGHGVFREFAELLILLKTGNNDARKLVE